MVSQAEPLTLVAKVEVGQLSSRDGKSFTLDTPHAKLSLLVKGALESDPQADTVPLSMVDSVVLEPIVRYLKHRAGAAAPDIPKPLIDTDLSDDHPISISWDTNDDGLRDDIGTPPEVAGESILYGASQQIECASCHDVHDNTNAPFLRVDNAASALCLSCHDK